MNNLFSKLFGKPMFVAPKNVEDSLNEKFSNILNVEWNKSNNLYEAIFYKDQHEYIAIFTTNGELVEYKKFLPQGFLPKYIIETLSQKGEIMNAVMINKGNNVSYEVIIRDLNLKRFLYLLNETGVIIETRNL